MGKPAPGEVVLMYGTVVALVVAMAGFLYVADPTFHALVALLQRLAGGA
jgi:preprotein translocase subunit SecE